MTQLTSLFKEYCKESIAKKTTPLTDQEKVNIVASIVESPLKSVVQAYSILDFHDYKHLHAEGFDKYFGYKNSFITAENILEIVHPDDQEAFGKLYYLCLEGLMNMPIPTQGIGHFCISYRMRDAAGNYHRILETNNIIASDPLTNIPLVNLAQITLSKDLSKSNQVTYFFNIKDEQGSVEIMQAFLSNYDSKVNVFSENELKIARYIKQGLTSQQIAEQLFLSKHSIDKYRKNLLEKTGCVNSPQLVHYLENLNLL
ncbi:MAG: LuxR C-terminal-related transcriptional regulator [Bacteroidota bacterium]